MDQHRHLLDDQTIVLAHSLWWGFRAQYMKEHHIDIAHTVLLSPVTPDYDTKTYIANKSPEKISERPSGSVEALTTFVDRLDYAVGDIRWTYDLVTSENDIDFELNRFGDFFGEEKLTIYPERGHYINPEDADILIEHLLWVLQQYPIEQIINISPLKRCFQTIAPYLQLILDEETFWSVQDTYKDISERYQQLFDDSKLIDYLYDPSTQKRRQLHEHIRVDRRISDTLWPEFQGKSYDRIGRFGWDDKPLWEGGESTMQVFSRCQSYISEISEAHPTKTIVTISHGDPIALMKKVVRDFDYNVFRNSNYPSNAEIYPMYRDNDRSTEVDLHRPVIDGYWFTKGETTYKRIPDVLDCRYESGSMPYGQEHYLGNQSEEFSYPAQFIAEGLDQTRGWFYGLHVIGNIVRWSNAYQNVIVNGLVLAEDGKKMSKRLKNYPDPKGLLEQYGADAFRLYLLDSPIVRAEPLRFSEQWVEQVLKDFVIPLTNVMNFFSTYADVDDWKDDSAEIRWMRHPEADDQDSDAQLTETGQQQLLDSSFIERVLRVDADVILHSPYDRTRVTWEAVQKIYQDYLGREVELIESPLVFTSHLTEDTVADVYTQLQEQYRGKRILCVSHNKRFRILRKYLTQANRDVDDSHIATTYELAHTQAVRLPSAPISNELDKRILAELHQTISQVDSHLAKYELDGATRPLIAFVDSLTNRYLRRSRRRFRASGMEDDKQSAYQTLYTVLETYLRLAAPFAPFVTESLYLQLQKYSSDDQQSSVHLQHYPIAAQQYIDPELIEEITTVRKIIKAALYVRSKNQIKIKQPLQQLNVRV